MKSASTTEAEMRNEEAPTPESLGELNEYIASLGELNEYIASLVDREHDYGTAAYAMSLAATAAFNHVASKLGVTGFQASCADLDILRRTRSMEGPFMLLKAENMVYPQYSLPAQLREAMEGWKPWVAKECAKKLKEQSACPEVKAHWEKMAAEAK